MKKRTLTILKHLPFIGPIIEMRVGEIWWCSPFMEWYWNDPEAEPVRKWCNEHRDEVLTTKLMHEILNNAKK